MQVDIHSHLLPGIDDGAKTLEQAQKALQTMCLSGVRYLAFTPHFYPSQMALSSFLERRERAWQKVKVLPEAKEFYFALGAEVYLTEGLFNQENLMPLCYQGTTLMLTEPETLERFSPSLERRLLRLIEDHGITPVLAHIDRYPFLVKDREVLRYLRQMGCLFQVNLEAFSPFLLRRRLFRLAEDGLIHFLGQDVHQLPILGEKRKALFAAIEKGCGGLLETLDQFARSQIFQS